MDLGGWGTFEVTSEVPSIMSFNPARFTGQWIGQTVGIEAPAHLWDISYTPHRLVIKTRWEADGKPGAYTQYGYPLEEDAFELRGILLTFRATLVSPGHFIIPGWDTNDTRGHRGPHYDVIFSRPGLAELQAEQVWAAHHDRLPGPVESPPPKPRPTRLTPKKKA